MHAAEFSASSIAVQRTTDVPRSKWLEEAVGSLQLMMGLTPELSSAVGYGHSTVALSRPLSVGTVKSPEQSILGGSVSAINLHV